MQMVKCSRFLAWMVLLIATSGFGGPRSPGERGSREEPIALPPEGIEF